MKKSEYVEERMLLQLLFEAEWEQSRHILNKDCVFTADFIDNY